MRICILASTKVRSLQTRARMRYFAERGHEVHVITHDPGNVEGVKIHRLPRLPDVIEFLIYPFVIALLLRVIKPDLVHSSGVSRNGFYTSLAGFHPTVIFTRGGDVLDRPKWNFILNVMARFSLKKADYVVAVGRHMIDDIEELGVERRKIVHFPVGTYPEKFSPKAGKSERNTVVSIRKLKPEYNLELLLKAIPKVLERKKNVKFLIAGSGPSKPKLEKLAEELGISRQVEFVGYLNPNNELPKFLAEARVYVSTSLFDGCPVSLLEAMSCETFPVVTDIDANRELIENGVNGFLVSCYDPQELADKIIEALERENFRKVAAKKCREVVLKSYDFEEIMGRLEKFYLKVVGR